MLAWGCAALLAVSCGVQGHKSAAGPGQGGPRGAGPTFKFGETMVARDCLHLSAVAYHGRQGDVQNHDWVTVRVVNRCDFPLRRLLVELWLTDGGEPAYGRRIWLLARQQFLSPGNTYTERYALPDPDSRIATGWRMKVLRLERMLVRRPR